MKKPALFVLLLILSMGFTTSCDSCQRVSKKAMKKIEKAEGRNNEANQPETSKNKDEIKATKKAVKKANKGK